MDDNTVYEPLSEYANKYKDLHARNTSDLFEELLAKSGVDEQANVALVRDIRALEADLSKSEGRRSLLVTLNVISIIVAILSAAFSIFGFADDYGTGGLDGGWLYGGLVLLAVVLGLVSWKKLFPSIRELKSKIDVLRSNLAAKKQEATAQMEPLNSLFDWGMPGRLVHKTVPRIEMDPIFSVGRLRDLERVFNLDDSFNRGRSVVGVQSGEINGNPFVLANTFGFEWTPHEYSGSITIHWTESVRGPDGKRTTVHRSEVLTATVTHPVPEFGNAKFLIFGNVAAPDLVFNREPSELSGKDPGKWTSSKKRALKKLQKKAAAIEDGKVSDYTLMSNHEFEVLFNANDRNNEIQFRLLFTPYAQQQMVNLLNDTKIGYGDDFAFHKSHMINCIVPAHFGSVSFDTSPTQYADYELAVVRRRFNDFNNEYFKGLYFALAPLLTIPLYQYMRSHESIWGDVISRSPSFWEHESLANFHGEDAFRHEASITRNILKTELKSQDGAEQVVAVTAHGFRGEPRVDHVRKFGGDGRWHTIPVEWTEYLPVSRTSDMRVYDSNGKSLQEYNEAASASEEFRAAFRKWNPREQTCYFRRSLLSYLDSNLE